MDTHDGYPEYTMNTCLCQKNVTDAEVETWNNMIEEESEMQTWFSLTVVNAEEIFLGTN